MATAGPAEQPGLRRLYGATTSPLWLDAKNAPGPKAAAALQVLASAGDDGLNPRDYHVPAARGEPWSFEVRLSAAVLRYLDHLQSGRLDPRAVGWSVPTRVPGIDPVTALREAWARDAISDLPAQMAPPLVTYRRLREALAGYRTLAAQGLSVPDIPASSLPLDPAAACARAAMLEDRLIALGDLAPAAAAAPERCEERLARGMRHFQERHGLAADGLVGRATLAALQVPLQRRTRQIELAMERLRWLPDLRRHRTVGVNLPMFWLWTWDPRAVPFAAPGPAMPVIVGRAASTPTPVFIGRMTHLTFQPYWNVPRSIVRAEILPALARDPDYLRRHDMELVRGQGDTAPVLPESPERMRELQQGTVRLRQRPGPHNPLGGVRFAVDNESQIYLHATPASDLFLRGRRDFSHGCIRVQDPIALARWALAGRPAWGAEEVSAAFRGSKTLSVGLPEVVQVVVYYSTALARPGDGALLFSEDLYGLDATLEAAWARPR